MTLMKFQLGGQNVDFPLEAFDLAVQSNFVNDNVQPTIDISDLTVLKEWVSIINMHIANGLFYKGLPISITANSTNIFQGFINLPQLYEILNNGDVRVGIIKKDGLDNLQERLESITWAMLDKQGNVKNSDYTKIEYVVEKSNNAFEIIMLAVIIYVMGKELNQNTITLIKLPAKVVAAATPAVGFGAVVTVGQIVLAALELSLQLLYISLMLIVVLDMAKRLFDLAISPKREHKMLNFRRGLQIIANRLGLVLFTNISELNDYNYLPSNIEVDVIDLGIGKITTPKGVSKGYPKSGDYGFTAFEFVDIMLTMFNAQLIINGNQLVLLPKNDPFWRRNSTYIMPDVKPDKKRYNADELVFSRLLKYETDPIADEYTLSNFKGTNYQILTRDNSLVVGSDDNFIKKHETIDFRLALGNRKDKLNAVEKTLKSVGSAIDTVTGVFGGGTNFANKIKNRVGVLKVGTNNHTKPKLIYLKGGKIPENHRDFTSAKYLYDKYINEKSFVANNFAKQKAIYSSDSVPFGMAAFLQTSQNSYAKDSNGNEIKIRESKWNILNDVAAVEWEEQEIFAPNLFEEFIEQN